MYMYFRANQIKAIDLFMILWQVRSAFAMAFRLLTDIKYNDLVSPHFSILGRIIRVDEKLLGRQARFYGSLSIGYKPKSTSM